MTEFGGQRTEGRRQPIDLLAAALMPLLVLFAASFLANLIAYFAVMVFGDEVSYRIIFKRSVQLFLVLSIFPLMYGLKLNKTDLGFVSKPLLIKQIVRGFCLGLVTLLPVLVVLYVLGVQVMDEAKPWTTYWLGKKFLFEFLLAILISLVEEPIYRGIMITGFNKKMPMTWAILAGAFYYAGLHFVNSDIEIPAHEAGLFSGFILLDDAFAHLLNRNYLSPFFALFTVGVFLGMLRAKYKTGLGLCIGCHAAWVFQIKLSKILFNTDPKSEYLYLVSGYDGVIGPLVTLWLALVIIAYWSVKTFMLKSETR